MKRITRALYVVYVALAVYILLRGGDRALLGPVSLLFLLIPPLVERLFRMKLGGPLRVWLLVFCLLGFHLGTALHWYQRFLGFDKVVHLLSGIFFAQVGLCFYGLIGGDWDRRKKPLLQYTYAFCFAMCIAAFWEICEYAGFLLTGHDAQNVATTGIHDTMQDIIACFLGAGILGLGYLRFLRGGRTVFLWPVLAFDAANGAGAQSEEKGEKTMQVHPVIDGRRSVRKYTPDIPVTEEQIEALLRAAMLAPSAHNSRQWGFVVLRDRAILDYLAEHHPYGKMMRQAPLAIIVLAKPHANPLTAAMFPQDCSAATMNILTQATAMGLGSCWCGLYPVEALVSMMRGQLGLSEAEVPFSMIAIGTPEEIPPQRGKYEPERVIWR